MFKPVLFLAKLGIAAATLLFVTVEPSYAQHRGGGGGGFRGGAVRGGGYRGGGWGGGWGWGGGLWLGAPYYGGYYGYPAYDYGYYGSPSYYSTPAPYYTYQAPTAVTADPGYALTSTQQDNTAVIDVRVPADAQVFVDGRPTQQRGTERLFHTPPLSPGTFTYELQATWSANGTPTTVTRQVQVQAGRHAFVNFMEAAPDNHK